MQDSYDTVDRLGATAIAVAQEDTDLESHGKFLARFPSTPRFDIVADLNRAATPRYRRTTTYVIDREGIVRQIIPNTVRSRAAWPAVFKELERLDAGATTRPDSTP